MQTAVKVDYQKIVSKRHSYTGSDDGPPDSQRHSHRERNHQKKADPKSSTIQTAVSAAYSNRSKKQQRNGDMLAAGVHSQDNMQSINIGKNEIISYQKPVPKHPEGQIISVIGGSGMGQATSNDGRSGICLNTFRNGQSSIDSQIESNDFVIGSDKVQPKYVGVSRTVNDELYMQDSQFSNIVLDDFRKQVKGLEEQVESQSFGEQSKNATPQHQMTLQAAANKLTPTNGKKLQPQESTDLDDSHPMISIIKARGDTSVMDIITKKGIETGKQIVVRKTVAAPAERTVTSLLQTETGQPDMEEKIITQHEIDEMRRRLQRRAQGLKSDQNSYMIKLDPNYATHNPSHHAHVLDGRPAANHMRLHSMGSVRQGNKQRERMEAQQLARGQNQFMKSFMQNTKNTSLFNHFLGRCSQGNSVQQQSKVMSQTIHNIGRFNHSAQMPQRQSVGHEMSFKGLSGVPQRLDPSQINQNFSNHAAIVANKALKIENERSDETALQKNGFTLNELPLQRHTTETLSDHDISPFGFANTLNSSLPLSILRAETMIEPRLEGAPDQSNKNNGSLANRVEEIVSTVREETQRDKTQQSLQGSKVGGPPSFRQQEPFISSKPATGTRNDISVSQTNAAQQLPQFNSREVNINMSGLTSPGTFKPYEQLNLGSSQNSTQKRVSIPVSTQPLGYFKKKTQSITAQSEQTQTFGSPKSRKSGGSPTTLNRSSPRRRQTLASLVSAGQLPVVAEKNGKFNRKESPAKRQPNVNVKIQLIPSSRATCTCNVDHQQDCGMEKSESTQMIDNINSKFTKQDIKYKLAKNNQERRKFRTGSTNQKTRLASQQNSRGATQQEHRDLINASKVSKTGNLIVCSCNGLQCCTLNKNPSVEGCLCIVHSFKYQVASRNQLNAHLANAEGDSLKGNSVEHASFHEQNMGLLPTKRVKKHNRNKTMVQWNQVNPSYTDASSQIKNYRSGKKTAGQGTRRTRLSLTQILANGQASSSYSKQRVQLMQPQGSLQNKLLPGVASAQRVNVMHDHNGSFDSSIEGARLTFIKQLRQSSKETEKGGSNTHENSQAYESQSALYNQYMSSTEGFPPGNFKQIINEARESADISSEGKSKGNSSSEQQQPKVLTLDQLKLQSIFSVENIEHKKPKRESPQRQSKGTEKILQDSMISQTQVDGQPNQSPSLSVKKQLRLQKMALQGMDYRPKPGQQKVFDKDDMKEYFRSTLERSAITGDSRNTLQVNKGGGTQQILAQESSCIDGGASFISMTDPNQTGIESTAQSVQVLQESKFNNTHDAGINEAYHHNTSYFQDGQKDKQSVWRYARSGAVSFRRDLGSVDSRKSTIKEEGIASPMSEFVRSLNFQHSKQTEAWLKQDEQKKLEQSQNRIKKYTAEPVMTIEQTKARNNQVMMRKIQQKVKVLNQRRTQRQAFANEMEYYEKLQPIQDRGFYEESLFSKRSRQRQSNRDGYRSFDKDYTQIGHVLNNSRQHFVSIDEQIGPHQQSQYNEDVCANSRAAGIFENSSLFRPTQAINQKKKPTINMRLPGDRNTRSPGSPKGVIMGAKGHFAGVDGGATQDHITLFDGARLDPVAAKPAKTIVEYEVHMSQGTIEQSAGIITAEQPSIAESNTFSLKKDESDRMIQMTSSAVSTERAPIVKTEMTDRDKPSNSKIRKKQNSSNKLKAKKTIEQSEDRQLQHTNGEWQALISSNTQFRAENLK